MQEIAKSVLVLKEIRGSLAKHQLHFGEKGVWLDSQITFHECAVIECDVSTKVRELDTYQAKVHVQKQQ